mmetsp:Transcript_17542/g.45004  ORF Transcript_17542/g.45004 Transcript_17542/m.45004 type:complete len:224 (+) Transcript_17542:929-1600(+)
MLAHRVLRLHRREEVARDQLRALVDQLVEGVLAVGAWLSPDDRAGRDGDGFAAARDTLAVGLHVSLLEVRAEAVQVLIVRQDRVRLGTKKVAVPHAERREEHRQVAAEGRCEEVLVHLVCAGQELDEVLPADRERDRRADRRPRRVAAAHPVPKAEHVGRVDAERRHGVAVGGERGKVLGDGGRVGELGEQPLLRRLGVRHRLLRRERLRRDEEQGRLRVEIA